MPIILSLFIDGGRSVLITGGATSRAGDPGPLKVKKVGEHQPVSIRGPDDGCPVTSCLRLPHFPTIMDPTSKL